MPAFSLIITSRNEFSLLDQFFHCRRCLEQIRPIWSAVEIDIMHQLSSETLNALDQLLTPRETFVLLGLPESSGWAALAQGRIPQPIRIGRRTRWSRRALEGWIQEQHRAAQSRG